jgi:hypothetical protein
MRFYFLHGGLLELMGALDPKRDGMPTLVRTPESGSGNSASRQLGL